MSRIWFGPRRKQEKEAPRGEGVGFHCLPNKIQPLTTNHFRHGAWKRRGCDAGGSNIRCTNAFVLLVILGVDPAS